MADTASQEANPVPKGWPALQQLVVREKIKVAQWMIRCLTIFFTFTYILPIFWFLGTPYDSYQKVLYSSMATNFLRLHQRLPSFSFSKEFFQTLLSEDSFHYLFYAFVFQYPAPVTLVIIPLFLFALIHAASYSLTILDCLGQNSWWGARLLISLVEFQSRTILRLCAFCEIIILPLTVFLVFTGKAGMFTPIIYYQFLQLRLTSRRNPFTRNVFVELTNSIEFLGMKPSVPGVLKTIIEKVVGLMRRMIPVFHQQ